MTVEEIIRQVRWCIDEESNNISDLEEVIDEKEDSYMDNIIRANIPEALNWLAVSAPAQSLVLPNNTSDDFVKDYDTSKTSKVAEGLQYNKQWDETNGIGCITFPSENPIRLIRLRGEGWHKAIKQPCEEDADECLYMYDDTAKGTEDRPIAVIVRGNPTRLLIQPASESVNLTFARYVQFDPDSDGDADLPIPDSGTAAFIHYLAFLLLSAYDDTKASQMYTIALQQLGVSQTSKQ